MRMKFYVMGDDVFYEYKEGDWIRLATSKEFDNANPEEWRQIVLKALTDYRYKNAETLSEVRH